mgnify:CR=1 FL=1
MKLFPIETLDRILRAALLRRGLSEEHAGWVVDGLVETSLMEAMLDLQFEVISAHLNDRSVTVNRGGEYGAHAFLSAPYGIYPSADGYLALAVQSSNTVWAVPGSPGSVDVADGRVRETAR